MATTESPPLAVDDPTAVARGTIYGTLAALFEEPDEEIYRALADGQLATELEVLLDRADLDVAIPALATDDDYELLCARFNDVFEVGYPEPPVPLYESAHRTDGEWEDVNLDLARAYDYFGVSIDESVRDHHDHLQLELEFAGYLSRVAATGDEDGVRRARRDFLDRHLDPFVSAVATELDDEVETGVYADIVDATESFVAADLADLTNRSDSGVAHQ
ncbi:MAG: molecular chaperone TorD family protein [Halanaeroarchaeum sp.]